MNQITQQCVSSSEPLAASAEEMTGQAEPLMCLIEFFRIGRSSTAMERHLTSNNPVVKAKFVKDQKRINDIGLSDAKFGRF